MPLVSGPGHARMIEHHANRYSQRPASQHVSLTNTTNMCHHKHRVIAGSIHHILSARVGHAVKQAPVPFLVQNAAPEPSPEVPTEVDATDGPAPAPEKASFADTQQRQQLWNSVSRCLLKLGSRGAAESHIRWVDSFFFSHRPDRVSPMLPLSRFSGGGDHLPRACCSACAASTAHTHTHPGRSRPPQAGLCRTATQALQTHASTAGELPCPREPLESGLSSSGHTTAMSGQGTWGVR